MLKLFLSGLLAILLFSCTSPKSDPEIYLFSYFKDNGQDGLHMAYSHDGLDWKALNNNESLLQPQVGEDKLMRDPCIIKGGDGKFHMVWTVSWGEKGIGYANSEDLIHWSEQQYIPVMEHEPEALNCWAPEIYYDEDSKQYMIYWATTIPGRFPETDLPGDVTDGKFYNHRMYYTLTHDFKAFSETKILYDHGFNVIDATIQKIDGVYTMFLKDETKVPEPEKNIRIATSNQLLGPYSEPSEPITPDWVEGPTVIKTDLGWTVYVDFYTHHKMGAVASTDLQDWTDVSDKISFPTGTRHGTVFRAKQSLLDSLLTLTGIPRAQTFVPTRVITQGPKHHWFGYYDKLEFDPTGRYVLAAQVDFESRSPEPTDTIRVGMIDLEQGDTWTELGTSVAWGWQQGCMLQFIPGSDSKIIWNDRQGDQFVSHIKDIHTGEQKTLPFPIYTLSPDGKTALSVDFERINDLRRGYGYGGLADPNKDNLAPENAGIYRCDLETGEKELIISLAQMNQMDFRENEDPLFRDFYTQKNWFNHLLFNTDGSRFVFLHRWKAPSVQNMGFGTLMYSSDLSGKDIRMVDPSGYTSHFIWRDPEHLMMWTRRKEKDAFYLIKDDGSTSGVIQGEDIMKRNGHNTYLPGNEWVLNDTYPDADRMQHVYLFHLPTQKRIPIGDFYADPVYKGEWRIDTHPRSSPDGKKVVIDCPVGASGRQLVMMDISGIVKM